MNGRNATIATHKGTQYCPEHNRRETEVCSKEHHIDLNRPHENWVDIDVKTAFGEIFGEAVNEYNNKQKRADRRIADYYEKIRKDKKHQPVQELIVGVYYYNYDAELSKKVLKEFTDKWQERNPSLHIIGAYYHDDEQSKRGPHVHIDYIPVGSGYTRGMSIQCSQEKALNELGFFSKGKHGEDLASTKWIHRENKELEKICNEHGITVVHLLTGDSHLRTNSYKKVQAEKTKTEERIKELQHKSDEIKSNNIILNSRNKEIEIELEAKTKMIENCAVPPIFPTTFKDKRSNVLIDKPTYEALQQRSKVVSDAQVAVENLKDKSISYAFEIKHLRDSNAALQSENNMLKKDNSTLKNAYHIVYSRLNNIYGLIKSDRSKNPLISSIYKEITGLNSDTDRVPAHKEKERDDEYER